MQESTDRRIIGFFKNGGYVLLLCSLIFAGCNKKYYAGVAKAKDDDSKFVILKTGEKIEIESAKMHSSSGTIVSIDKPEGKSFDKKDIVVVQNNTAYYKKFYFSASRPSYHGEAFAERTRKGAVNVYSFVATTIETGGSKGMRNEFIYFTALEDENTKEAIVYRGMPDTKQIERIREWFSRSEGAISILDKWEKLSAKRKRNYG